MSEGHPQPDKSMKQDQTAERASSRTAPDPSKASAERLPSDIRIAGAVWPALLASVVGLLPFTVFSTFLVQIADATGESDAAVGALRGLGGVGAVLVGVAVAPLIGRIAPGRIAAAALVLLAVASVLGTVPLLPALAAFCLVIGVSNAALYPALSTAAADRFGDAPAAGRAATLVMSTQTLAATLAAPLIAFPALWWGWQGDLIAIAVVASLLTPVLYRYRSENHIGEQQRFSYLEAFRVLAAVPGARPLILVAFGRAGAFMGYLAYLAPFYADSFGLTPEMFAFVWTLSGGAFFLGHLVAGRLVNVPAASDRRAHLAMRTSLLTALLALVGVYLAPELWVALVATAVLSASHAVVAAAVVTLLVRRCGAARGTALSLNASGMSLGLFLGTAAGGAGLVVAGYLGAALVFALLTLFALGAALKSRPQSLMA
ncbi:MFS transporter [Pseudonocardia oroxyli]|uniref:Predicted arabinose efflux permease, MFS family n=1 Tax=Pseudonocardia oroxyli TaxID=366584 RepID=A0A1G7WX51_PSEOR|nr:MFS transporter [Pseudonocardia oroxyli]SDG76501.1 Predicted arabinose efflux permease, MFS family [Pseudonocardia oroxyli]